MADGVTRAQVEDIVRSGRRVLLVDVRSAEEFAAGSVPGAIHVLPDRLAADLPRLPADAVVVAVCDHGGPRSQGAAELLREAGFATATHLVGGVQGYST